MSLEREVFGIQFPNPFILASGPPTANASMIIEAFKAGWGGAVTKTIGVNPTLLPSPRVHIIRKGRHLRGMVNLELITDCTLDQWCEGLDKIRDKYPNRPLFASIMGGGDPGEWQEVIQKLEPHGVSGFEMNVSCPNFVEGKGAQLGQDPESLRLTIGWVLEATDLPVIVKLTPNVTDIVPLACIVEESGAHGITATNTLSGLAGIDLETFSPLPTVNNISTIGGVSGPAIKPVSLRCVASIAQNTEIPLIGCGGIEDWKDAAEYFAVGSYLVQMCTAPMWNGYEIIDKLETGIEEYLRKMELQTVNDLTGKALPYLKPYPELDMSIKLRAEVNLEKCNGCGICVKACDSGGYQAIKMVNKKAVISTELCDGCGLCPGVCPTLAIQMVERETIT